VQIAPECSHPAAQWCQLAPAPCHLQLVGPHHPMWSCDSTGQHTHMLQRLVHCCWRLQIHWIAAAAAVLQHNPGLQIGHGQLEARGAWAMRSCRLLGCLRCM
jgi:hypothetical protein